MKTKLTIKLASALLLGLTSLSSQAALDVNLFDLSWSYHDGVAVDQSLPGDSNQVVDKLIGGSLNGTNPAGITTNPSGTPTNGFVSISNDIFTNNLGAPQGLGLITVTIDALSTASTHSFDMFFNHDLFGADDVFFETNDTVDPSGTLLDTALATQSWEAGNFADPSHGFSDPFDTLPSLATTRADLDLTNANGITAGGDAFMAMGYDIFLDIGQQAVITFDLTTLLPTGTDFFLEMTDDFNDSFYLISSLAIDGIDLRNAVPEPSIIFLMGAGMIGMLATRRRQLKIA